MPTEPAAPASPEPGQVTPATEPAAPASAVGPTGGTEIGRAATPGSGTLQQARYGLSLRFERREDDELGRLVESTIWVNEAHPAYERAQVSRSMGYHVALAVALALAPPAVAPSDEHAFLTRFLAEWGSLAGARRHHRRKQLRPPVVR